MTDLWSCPLFQWLVLFASFFQEAGLSTGNDLRCQKRWEKETLLLPVRSKPKNVMQECWDFTKMVCCKLHLDPILWEFEGAEHYSSIVSDMKSQCYDPHILEMTNSKALINSEIEYRWDRRCDVKLKGKPTLRYWEEDQELWSCRQRMSQNWESTDRASLCRLVQTHFLLVYVV